MIYLLQNVSEILSMVCFSHCRQSSAAIFKDYLHTNSFFILMNVCAELNNDFQKRSLTPCLQGQQCLKDTSWVSELIYAAALNNLYSHWPFRSLCY